MVNASVSSGEMRRKVFLRFASELVDVRFEFGAEVRPRNLITRWQSN